MSITLSGSITGGTMSQFTTPAYTVTTDTAPDVNGKQFAVTTIGGTQTGVRSHAVSDPFTITFYRPKSPKALQNPNPITGKYGPIPRNTHGCVVRKGVNYAANQAPDVATFRGSWDIPAGSDAYDSANVRALHCFLVGSLSNQSQGVADMLCNGII
jgi:hypothetical protein